MAEPAKDFEELLAAFARHGVKSLIVGAHAVAFHARPRYTKDLDVLLEPSPTNAARVVAAIGDCLIRNINLSTKRDKSSSRDALMVEAFVGLRSSIPN